MADPIPFHQEVLRKLIHLSSLWMVALIWFYPCSRYHVFFFFAVLLILNLLCERAYSSSVPVITPLYAFFFRKMLRGPVKPGQWVVSGSPPVFAAAAMVSLLYKPHFAAIALGVMLVADTAAALIGRRFGKHKAPNGKSWEGCIAFLIAGAIFTELLLYLGGDWNLVTALSGLAGVTLAMLAELFEKQLHVDDNFSIPLVVGGCLAAGSLFV